MRNGRRNYGVRNYRMSLQDAAVLQLLVLIVLCKLIAAPVNY
jgi:hypothetical protein